MKVFKNINSVPRSIKNTTVAIGNFDGIHLGHQKIFTNAGFIWVIKKFSRMHLN